MRPFTTLTIITTLFLIACGTKEPDTKDIFFGLEVGMHRTTADSIIADLFVKDEAVNFGQHISQIRRDTDGEIHTNLYKPTVTNEHIESMTYMIQVMANTDDFSDKIYKGILDGLKQAHGNAKSVNWPDDNTSELKWEIQNNINIDLTIDKVENMYTIKYYKKK